MSYDNKKSFWSVWLMRIWVLLLALLLSYLCYLPDVAVLRHHNPTTTAYMELRAEQARKANRPYKARHTWCDLDDISSNLVHAVLLAEDDTFYQHHGFDLEQIREAIRTNWKQRRYAYGGSTITQQLARTLYLSPRKNLLRKMKEALITYRLEHTLSKHRILELYLNVVEWGRGIYGAEAAAEAYYNKSAAELTPDEAVALVSILPSPRRWDPTSEKAFMARRRTKLLERMERAGYVPAYIDYFPPDSLEPPTPGSTPPPPSPSSGDLQGEYIHIAPQQPS
jgi:monofunctional biosynthetic peptidoglycan transglycosylase